MKAGVGVLEDDNPACCACWGYRTDIDGKGLSDFADHNFDKKPFNFENGDKNGSPGNIDTFNPKSKADYSHLMAQINLDEHDSDAGSSEQNIARIEYILCPPAEKTEVVNEWLTEDGIPTAQAIEIQTHCKNSRNDKIRWTVQEKTEYMDLHHHDWRDCHAYGRNVGEAQCMWDFRANQHKYVSGMKNGGNQFICQDIGTWRANQNAHVEIKVWYFLAIAVIAFICACPACFRMPCYKKYCNADYDICCKSEKQKVIDRNETLYSPASPTADAEDSNTSEQQKVPIGEAGKQDTWPSVPESRPQERDTD